MNTRILLLLITLTFTASLDTVVAAEVGLTPNKIPQDKVDPRVWQKVQKKGLSE